MGAVFEEHERRTVSVKLEGFRESLCQGAQLEFHQRHEKLSYVMETQGLFPGGRDELMYVDGSCWPPLNSSRQL